MIEPPGSLQQRGAALTVPPDDGGEDCIGEAPNGRPDLSVRAARITERPRM